MDLVSSSIPRFDFVDLKLFVNVAEEGSLTRGGKRSFLSLAATSMRIKNLEEALGATLLHRVRGGVTLTEPGRVFADHARQMLRQIERLRGAMQPFSRGLRGHVRLFANTTAISEFLPSALGEFLAAHDTITIDLQERLSSEIVRGLHEGLADIGVVAGSVRMDGLESLPYKGDRLVLAVPVDHPLAEISDVRFADVLDFDFVGLDRYSAIHSFLEQEVSQLGRAMQLRIQVRSFDAMCRMIDARVGIGVLPEQAALRHAKSNGIRIVQLLDQWAIRELRICMRHFGELPVFARELIDHLLRTR